MADFNPYEVLLRPVTSEKAYFMKDQIQPDDITDFRQKVAKARKAIDEEVDASQTLTPEEKRKLKALKKRRVMKQARRQFNAQLNANQNKVVFIVKRSATKPEIKRAIETIYNVEVEKVNTHHTKQGKQAIIKLKAQYSADNDIFTRVGGGF